MEKVNSLENLLELLDNPRLNLTQDMIDNAPQDTIVHTGIGIYEHPRFNQCKHIDDGGSLINDRDTIVKFVVFKIYGSTRCIIVSLSTNFLSTDDEYYNSLTHILAGDEMIRAYGDKIHSRDIIKSLINCDDSLLDNYRH